MTRRFKNWIDMNILDCRVRFGVPKVRLVTISMCRGVKGTRPLSDVPDEEWGHFIQCFWKKLYRLPGSNCRKRKIEGLNLYMVQALVNPTAKMRTSFCPDLYLVIVKKNPVIMPASEALLGCTRFYKFWVNGLIWLKRGWTDYQKPVWSKSEMYIKHYVALMAWVR